MKTFRQRVADVYNDEVIEGSIYRIDLDRVDVIPVGSTGIMRSLPLTGDRDKIQVGDRVRVVRVGGERVAMVGDVALGFDIEETATEPTGGITPLELEGALADREAPNVNYVQKNDLGQVGINRAPDPQFDLDVAGSIRTGGYFVGPHALQLAGAKLIAHFDGPDPLATDTKGEPNGHMGQIGMLAGTYDYRPGRFNKALHLAPGATLSYASDKSIDITKPGTLSFWRRKEVGDSDTANGVWLSVGTAAPNYLALKNSADNLSLEFVLNATTLTMLLPDDNAFHHYALTWDGSTASLYIDGVRHPEYLDEVTTQSGAYTAPTVNPATLLIGDMIHTLDDLASLDRAASAEEVLAVFESDAPVFAETSTWGFRSPNTLSYVDSEGLWAVSSAGNPAFGVSGVNGKAWGGQTLDAGDVLIGRGTSYAKWDDSTGTFSFAADGSGITNINGSNITTGTISADRIDVASLSVGNANITEIDASKITSGYINAARINTGTITAGMLSATAIDGKTITGATIKTSATNPNILIDSTGLIINDYNSNDITQTSLKFKSSTLLTGTIASYWDTFLMAPVLEIDVPGGNKGSSNITMFSDGLAVSATAGTYPASLTVEFRLDPYTGQAKLLGINAAPSFRVYGGGGTFDTTLSVGGNATLSGNVGVQRAVSSAASLAVGNHGYTGATGYGLYIDTQSGATTNNYALYTNAGAVRFGGAVACASTISATAISTTLGTSGATYYPIACTNVFDHTTGVGNAVTGSHQINLAGVGGIPTDAIAVAGRIGGNFGTAGNNYYVSVRKWGEAGTGIFACVCRSLDININHDDTFVVNTAGTTVSVNFEVVGAGCERAYMVVYGYWAKL